MNYIQIALFVLYVLSVLSCGLSIISYIDKNGISFINKSVFWGETLLLGSIFIVGQLFMLSFFKMYTALYLWGVIIINCCFFLNKNVRKNFTEHIKISNLDFSLVVLIALITVFVFRNLFFLIDIDSMMYLNTQKLWLLHKTSIVGNMVDNINMFSPQFNAVPYSLGLAIFGQETLFPSLVNILWRLIVILLVFGYTSHCLNRYLGLAAVMFAILNEHMFYSGVNNCVIINGAVIAFMFGTAYNFWESRKQNSAFRLLLAFVFASQVPANKYQMVFSLLFIVVLGLFVQQDLFGKIKEILHNRRWISVFALAVFFATLWFVRNYLITRDPIFPIFAGKLHCFGWTPEREYAIAKYAAIGINPMKILKYMNFFFIWPGISAMKYVIIIATFFPLLLIAADTKFKTSRETLAEVYYWMGAAMLSVFGSSIIYWQDPRNYRYSIGIMAFAAVIGINFLFKYCMQIKKKNILSIAIIVLALYGGVNEGYKVFFFTGGSFKFPSYSENIKVLFNEIHTDYAMEKYYPNIKKNLAMLRKYENKLEKAVLDVDSFGYNVPFFFVPIRGVVSLLCNSLVQWESFGDEDLIVKDLKSSGIDWVVRKVGERKWTFVSASQYAKEAVKYERYPKTTYWNYGFPEELTKVDW